MSRAYGTVLIAAALVAAAGCRGPAPATGTGGEPLAEIVAAAPADPSGLADALEGVAPVPGEEAVRFRLLVQALERADAPPERWRRLLEAPPPPGLVPRIRLGLARALEAADRKGEAEAVLRVGMEAGDPEAALTLLGVVPPEDRGAVLRWLAVHAPRRLARLDGVRGREVVATLGASGRLDRAAALLESGAPRTAFGELRPLRVPRQLERRRRLLLARAALASRRPGDALRAVARLGGAEAALLRAQAWRARAWDRFPLAGASRAFDRALAEARRAVSGERERIGALELILECATERGRLSEAWEAWQRLEALGWNGERRGWLGRRLGVALALAGAERPVHQVAAALPAHRRCLEYWLARRNGDRETLERLAAGPVGDLYAWWAARRLGRPLPRFDLLPPLGAGRPPRAVAAWLDAGRRGTALELWWGIARVRGLAPREALALAVLEAPSRPHRAVRALRLGFPEIRAGRLDRVPRDVLALYLPLPYPKALQEAARVSGVPAWLLAGQVRQESLWVPTARSPRGARGLLQLLPRTARERARALGVPAGPLEDPTVNLRLGALELARLRDELGSLEAALAAYNGGLARVRRWEKRWPDPEGLIEAMPVPEMYGYVRRVVFLGSGYRELYDDVWVLAEGAARP